ncbi:MAG: hypothetical protein C0406_09840 [Sideroxydans sp.]|nr:hypothetical protein [Sideroxydans sp.]
MLPNFLINELAAQDGVKVVLNGAGGDELFAGYDHYFPTTIERRLQAFPKLTAVSLALLRPLNSEIAGKVDRALAYHSDRVQHYLGHTTFWSGRELRAILNQDGDVDETRREYVARFRGDALNSCLYADVKTYLTDDLMLLLDRMSMAHSLEGRVPFLHHPLVNLALGVPDEIKALGGERKGLLKFIARSHLPADLLQQPKMGFNSPVREWVQGPLGTEMVRFLLSERSLNRPWWNRPAFKAFVGSPIARGRHFERLFILFMLEVYCRLHLNGAYTSPPNFSLEDL